MTSHNPNSHAAHSPIVHTLLSRIVEPLYLFPLVAVVLLVVIWWGTYSVIQVDRVATVSATNQLKNEVAETYEAQVIRAIREIDQTLKLVQYAYLNEPQPKLLQRLNERELLLPEMIFQIGIFDKRGNALESTSSEPQAQQHIGQWIDSSATDVLSIGLPRQDPKSQEWRIQFSRPLFSSDKTMEGVVVIEVDASYFVSGYEISKLGYKGVLGLIGTDGVMRVRRVGETVSAGQRVDYVELMKQVEQSPTQAIVNSWDNELRYTIAREMYELPLAVVIGLSQEERFAATEKNAQVWMARAIAASLLVVFITWLLGRLSHQLALSRKKVVEEQLAHAERVEYLAYHDGLTGLPNRSLFSKLLSQSIQQAQRYERKLAVLFLDLDRFKQINDTLGHDAGDDLLKEVAKRLRESLRESDTVARLGGDEFVVLVPELEDEKYCATVAQKILSNVAHPFILVGQEFRVTASIGIGVFPQDGLDEQTLKKNADVAMYKAKQEGKNNYQFYSEELNANSLERLTIESGLRRALEKNEFELYYQGKYDITHEQITGMEALLRWRHPDLGIVEPNRFLTIAEETGLIIPIGKWVIRTACEQIVKWQKQGFPKLSISVNLTSVQFQDDNLLPYIKKTLEDTGMDPHLLLLEVSESLLLHDVNKTLKRLKALRAMGVQIAIDDFGVGYSSLSTLKQFPLDMIKIDRSFIRNITNENVAEDGQAVTKAIIEMGRTLSLTVVAQGVETQEQAEFLRNHACDEFQGFYFNEPIPAEQVGGLLKNKIPSSPGSGRSESPSRNDA